VTFSVLTEYRSMFQARAHDFIAKYDSKVDAEKAALRNSTFFIYDLLGYMLKEGLLDREMIYSSGGFSTVWVWVKFHEVINYWRKGVAPKIYCSSFEYLAR